MSGSYAYDANCVAVIGMAGRLPGGSTLEEFWQSLLAGRICRERVEEQTLQGSVHESLFRDPDYVPYRYTVEGYDRFDAGFFDLSPREASLTDPQHRLALEYALRVFENAGYIPEDTGGVRTGVFASSDPSYYMMGHLYHHVASGSLDFTEVCVGNDKDYLSSRIAYKCNFKGPALTIQSACSSSLASVHMAVLSLLGGECDRALVAASTVLLPDLGYLYMEGGMRASGGLCRPYDAGADGTVFSSGAAAVLLKRLPEALEDGDHIWAVIRGSAANNDGGDKLGFVAPSVSGQAAAVRAALQVAGTAPEHVAYVEGHGTGTPMGDPVEVAALLEGYAAREGTRSRPLLLSSVKGNIGHLDASAGLASLIKACLALKRRVVPGTANFRTLNPAFGNIDPLRVFSEPAALERRDGLPLLAGVSAFGFGGTNVHAILQEAPEPEPRVLRDEPHLLVFSAPRKDSLEAMHAEAAAFFAAQDAPPLADAAYTLAVGRKSYAERGAVVVADAAEAAALLASGGAVSGTVRQPHSGVAFLFPGQGNLHAGAAAGFYAHDALFREKLHRVAALVIKAGGPDVPALLDACRADPAAAETLLASTETAQPVLFSLETAFAACLEERGIRPACLAGHSLGEYAAAVSAGVFTLEEGAWLIVRRARLMQQAPAGKMLVVSLGAEQITEALGGLPEGVEISVRNSPANCVLTGPPAALDGCARSLREQGRHASYLKTSHAFHSRDMDRILEPFADILAEISFSAPAIPFAGNVTGGWAGGEVASPEYWVRHLCSSVRFSECLCTLSGTTRLAVEAGPGHVMRALARQQTGAEWTVIPGLDHPEMHALADETLFLDPPRRTVQDVVADLWVNGFTPDWQAFYQDSGGRRCPAPGVALHKKRYWIEAAGTAPEAAAPRPFLSGADEEGPDGAEDDAAPATDVEKVLAGIWQELLFVPRVGVHDDFLSLGGNSIQIMQMIRLAAGRGLHFRVQDVFAGKTVAGLAARIGGQASGPSGGVVPPAFMARFLEPEHESACRCLVFACPDGFGPAQAARLAQTLAARHDVLRLVSGPGKEGAGREMGFAPGSPETWAGDRVFDLRADPAAGNLCFPPEESGLMLPEALQTGGGALWSLGLLPAPDHGGVRLLAVFGAAVADDFSVPSLSRDIAAFLKDGSLAPEGEPAAAGWAAWAGRLAGDAFARRAPLPRDQRLRDGGGLPGAAPGTAAFQNTGHTTDHAAGAPEPGPWGRAAVRQRQLGGAELRRRIATAAARCRVADEDVAAAAALAALCGLPGAPALAYILADGRGLFPAAPEPGRAVGAYTHYLPFPVRGEPVRPGEALPLFKEARHSLPGHGRRPIASPGVLDGALAGGSAGILAVGGPTEAAFRCLRDEDAAGGLLWSGEWNREDAPRLAAVEISVRLGAESVFLETRLPAEGRPEWADEFERRLTALLPAVAESGALDPACARYLPADFAGSGVTQADIARILNDLAA